MTYEIVTENGRKVLLFKMEEEDEELGQELLELPDALAEICIAEYFDGGCLSLVDPEDIGALTDAPIFVDLETGVHPRDYYYDAKGDVEVEKVGDIYWFPNYQIESMVETLVRSGEVRLPLAEED